MNGTGNRQVIQNDRGGPVASRVKASDRLQIGDADIANRDLSPRRGRLATTDDHPPGDG